jgi:hypothetical protein
LLREEEERIGKDSLKKLDLDNKKITMKKIIRLTEKDLQKIVNKVVSEQKIEVEPKGINPVFNPENLKSIKSQANALSDDIELTKQTLELIRRIDPEAYTIITKGQDPTKPTALGNLVNVGTVIALIYTIVQELRGK